MWFDGQAKAAADFYCSVFPDAKLLSHNPMVTTWEAAGIKFMGLNGGPQYQLNSSISFFYYAGTDEELDRVYGLLSAGGSVIMPLGPYTWSRRYAWITDQFGVNWQLDVDPIRSEQKIVPCLLFVNERFGQIKNALTHYVEIFPNSKVLLEAPYPANPDFPDGALLFAQIKLGEFILNLMSSTLAHNFTFSPAVSFVVDCANQSEIDYFWVKLGADGAYSQCGWLSDKFGVSWQIVPAILGELMADPTRSQQVMTALLKMTKFDIAALENA